MTTKSIQNTISAAKYVHQQKAEILYIVKYNEEIA